MVWDTLDTQPYFANLRTISGGGLTVTGISPALNGVWNAQTQALAAPFESKSSGDWCVEIRCVKSGGYDAFGVVGSAGIKSFIGNVGGAGRFGQFGIGYKQDGDINHDRFYLIGEYPIRTWGRWGDGDFLYIAMRLSLGLFWFRINGGPWLGLTDTGDPAAGTGGVPLSDYPLFGNGEYRPALSFIDGSIYTFNLGQAPFAFPGPAGLTPGWTNTNRPQFGSWLTGGGGGYTFAPELCVSPYVCPFDGVINELQSEGNSGATTVALGVVYDSDGAGGGPLTRLAKSTAGVLPGAAPGYVRYPLDSPLAVVRGHTYHLGAFVNPSLYGDISICGGSSLNGLWIDDTAVWPTPNANFVQSRQTTAHIPMVALGSFSGGGGGTGFVQGQII
ncbi:MAG TPA: hypothetical protein VGI30_09960 [Caulobacteraceae bacterium]